MPFLLPILADIPFILEGALGTAGGLATTAGLAGLASSGVGLAKTLSGTGAPQTPQLPTPTPPNPNQLLQQRELAGSQASNLESATSGVAGPDFLALFAPYLAGIQGRAGSERSWTVRSEPELESDQRRTNKSSNGAN